MLTKPILNFVKALSTVYFSVRTLTIPIIWNIRNYKHEFSLQNINFTEAPAETYFQKFLQNQYVQDAFHNDYARIIDSLVKLFTLTSNVNVFNAISFTASTSSYLWGHFYEKSLHESNYAIAGVNNTLGAKIILKDLIETSNSIIPVNIKLMGPEQIFLPSLHIMLKIISGGLELNGENFHSARSLTDKIAELTNIFIDGYRALPEGYSSMQVINFVKNLASFANAHRLLKTIDKAKKDKLIEVLKQNQEFEEFTKLNVKCFKFQQGFEPSNQEDESNAQIDVQNKTEVSLMGFLDAKLYSDILCKIVGEIDIQDGQLEEL